MVAYSSAIISQLFQRPISTVDNGGIAMFFLNTAIILRKLSPALLVMVQAREDFHFIGKL